MAKRRRSQELRCEVVNGRLSITIGIDTLAYCFVHGPVVERLQWDGEKGDWDPSRVRVSDPHEWAKETVHAMLHEAEDGSSPLTRFIDTMHDAALDDGSQAVEIPHLGLTDAE